MKDKVGETKLPVLMPQLSNTVRWLGRRLLEVLNIPLWLLSFFDPER